MNIDKSREILSGAREFGSDLSSSAEEKFELTVIGVAEEPEFDNTAESVQVIRERLAELDQSEGKTYWRSLEELSETEEFQAYLEQEFPRQSAPLESGLDRREFMKLLGASLALGGLTACVRPNPQEKIVPYVRAPEEIIPGKPIMYASAITQNGYAQGVLVENHNGRPTRLEGNPSQPGSMGSIDAQTTAEILRMYDPDRSKEVLQGGSSSDWDSFSEAVSSLDGNIAILTGTVTSPTLASKIDAVLNARSGAKWYQYSPQNADNVLAGSEIAFGSWIVPQYNFEEADIVLSLDADFVNSGPAKLKYARAFSDRRRVRTGEDTMNRLYMVESTPTSTGAMADHRLPMAASAVEGFAREVAAAVGLGSTDSHAALPDGWMDALVDDLTNHASVVVAGDEQPPIVHAIAAAINEAIGAVGRTVTYHKPAMAKPEIQSESIKFLVDDMNSGKIDTLVMIDSNPVYDAPADLDFAAALDNVATSIHLGLYNDETAVRSSWHVPQANELESWGDARAFDGTISIIQPQIQPIYGGKSPLEVLSLFLGTADTAYDSIRAFWQSAASGGDFNLFWNHVLYNGVVDDTASAPMRARAKSTIFDEPASHGADGIEIVFRPDPNIGSGKYSNSSWLQELPKPFTKLTWDNAALISPKLAEAEGLKSKDVINITVGDKSIDAPVWIMPGQAEKTITLHTGYGRTNAGKVGNGIGFDANVLRTNEHAHFVSASITKTRKKYKLVSTQLHGILESDGIGDRHITRGGTLADFQAHPEHPGFVHPVAHHASDLYDDFEYDGYAWGMVVDQTVCNGCNACITACQSENNIPVVGKDQVAVGREMQWLRVDAYYGGSVDNPEFFSQPVACMHCEKAPCEPVCPFGATVHDADGLNVMVYNRCGGTRYCSNNCPYKVRRFNFLQYAELEENAMALLQNPDVTVRSRGVMEKCTYCIQRIQQAYITSENEDRTIADGDVVTACQSACPTQAIVFGDINDENSEVAKVRKSKLNYGLFEELNTVPRTTYLARITNPHPSLAVASSYGSDSHGSDTHGAEEGGH